MKISRHDQVRFAVASHGWEDSDNIIYHAGEKVGQGERCVGEDIGLAEAEYEFSNEFLELNATAKKLLHSSLLTFGQFVAIDSAYTGRQRMFYSGIRAGPKQCINIGYSNAYLPFFFFSNVGEQSTSIASQLE